MLGKIKVWQAQNKTMKVNSRFRSWQKIINAGILKALGKVNKMRNQFFETAPITRG